MYKRIPATSFNACEDVYFAMISFMEECGFTIVSIGGIDLAYSNGIKQVYIMQDPNTIHKLCFILSTASSDNVADEAEYRIHIYIFDEFIQGAKLNEQGDIAKTKTHEDGYIYACGALFKFYEMEARSSNHDINVRDLVCIYINKTLMFAYVPVNCYIYSHVYNYDNTADLSGKPVSGSFLYYGNFTKYHISDINDCVFLFTSSGISLFGRGGSPSFSSISREYLGWNFTNASNYVRIPSGLLYCHPEASYTIGNNFWFVYEGYFGFTYDYDYIGQIPPKLVTSLDMKDFNGFNTELVDYTLFYGESCNRDKIRIENTLNNISVLMPLIVYGEREPRVLRNWSAIGETKLVNFIGMQHISSGDIFIDTGIEEDYHKYFVFPCLTSNLSSNLYTFLGLAIEIEAKENLLHSQSPDYLTIDLEDSFRNFDRFEIVYEGNNEVGWTYDDLSSVYDTDGVFNLTKDENNKCMVYGLKNENGESREYRFTCSESCEIISITGYRE